SQCLHHADLREWHEYERRAWERQWRRPREQRERLGQEYHHQPSPHPDARAQHRRHDQGSPPKAVPWFLGRSHRPQKNRRLSCEKRRSETKAALWSARRRLLEDGLVELVPVVEVVEVHGVAGGGVR